MTEHINVAQALNHALYCTSHSAATKRHQLSENTARAYYQLLKQFKHSELYKRHAKETLAAIEQEGLALWLKQWHWSKVRLSIAALRFMAKCNTQAFPAVFAIALPPKPRSSAADLLSQQDMAYITSLPLEHFGKQYPERNRALLLLVIETLMPMKAIRALQVKDVQDNQLHIASRPLHLQQHRLSVACDDALQLFLQWRWQRYGHCETLSPLFPANRGGEALGASGLYYMFRTFINNYGCVTGSAGDGLHCLRVSSARSMYAQGIERTHLEGILGMQRKGALEDFLRADHTLESQRVVHD